MIHEIPLYREYRARYDMSVTIHHVLVDRFAAWFTLYFHEGRQRYRSLVRIPVDLVTVSGGTVFIEADDLLEFFMRGYVLGAKYESFQPKYPYHETG